MDTTEALCIIGAGGHGRAVAEAAHLSGWTRICFIDDTYPERQEVDGFPIEGDTSTLQGAPVSSYHYVVAIGNQAVRQTLVHQLQALDVRLATIIHPKAWVSPLAKLGPACTIMAGAVVGAHADLGTGVIVNANATVDHDALLGDFAHLGVGVQLAGGVQIGKRVWLQAGCAAGYHVVVQDDTIAAPGTALIAGV